MDGVVYCDPIAMALGRLANRVAMLEAQHTVLEAKVAALEAENERLSDGLSNSMQIGYSLYDLRERAVLPTRRGESRGLALEGERL